MSKPTPESGRKPTSGATARTEAPKRRSRHHDGGNGTSPASRKGKVGTTEPFGATVQRVVRKAMPRKARTQD